jgi:hypothetical protein
MDIARADPQAELEAAWAVWGKGVLIVGLSRDLPFARVWQRESIGMMVEVGPGFLYPFLQWSC